MRKTELLIPAGSLDVLKTAVVYGADAVYIGGEAFGLRATGILFPYFSMVVIWHSRGMAWHIRSAE